MVEGFKCLVYTITFMTEVEYPQSPKAWREWIWKKLQISEKEGTSLFELDEFPTDRLLKVWNKEFSTDHGYSPQFIPALSRNVKGFVKWIYNDGPEPNWTKSDV
jgi:hypothetical protein